MHSLIVEVAVFLIIGGLIGLFGGLFGVGGAIMSIPILGIFFGMSEQLAQGTSLVMVVSNVVLALWQYSRHQVMDRKKGIALAISAIPFAYLGAHVATHIPGSTLRIAFGCFVLLIAAYMTWRVIGSIPATKHPLPFPFVFVVGAISGIMAGMFGIGGAMFTIPAMTLLFGMTQVQSQGMALALAVPGAFVGMATYAAAGDVDWSVGAALAVGGLLTVGWGAAFAHRLPDRTLRLLWVAFLVTAAIGLFLRSV
ncbi:MAG TPA: sulfite exporter TauE/SafE family protein [Candidatus Binatia bacterium]|nr:sulfite exporter TauE/SafE family protein [Candidatus Binatia bacterium]